MKIHELVQEKEHISTYKPNEGRDLFASAVVEISSDYLKPKLQARTMGLVYSLIGVYSFIIWDLRIVAKYLFPNVWRWVPFV